MKTRVLDISLEHLALAYILGTVVFALINIKKLKLNKHFFVSMVRMTIQLVAVGFLLKYVFQVRLPILIAAIFLFMSFNASRIVIARSGISFPYVHLLVFAGITIGPGLVLLFFIGIVVSPIPWYNPRFLIPIAGMILGNSMNGSALALERYFGECKITLPKIKTLISLGATENEASRNAYRKAYRAGLLPTLISMSSMGIVSLPGMMTGQILGGSPPLIAIKYQIGIMLAILSAVAISIFIILSLEQHQLFNAYGLPKDEILK